jgi:hypothetical protein
MYICIYICIYVARTFFVSIISVNIHVYSGNEFWTHDCRLVERFLMDGYEPRQDSTYALTLYRFSF